MNDERDDGVIGSSPDSEPPVVAADGAADDEVGLVVRAVPIVVLVMAACVVVAVGAGGAGLLVPPVLPGSGWRLAIRSVGAAAVIAGVIGLAVQRGQASYEGRGRDPTVAALLGAATIMTVLAVLSLLAPAVTAPADGPAERFAAVRPGEPEQGDEQIPSRATGPKRSPGIPGGFGLGLSGGNRGRSVGQMEESLGEERDLSAATRVFEWIGRILMPLLFLALAIGVWMITGRLGRAREEVAPGPPVAAESAEAGLQASLDELAHMGRDSRAGITAAYRALLAALAAAGAPREPQEAPHEHLYRALGPLGVRPEPMHRLTELYIVAQFSERIVTERHRIAAVEALEAALAGLRATMAFGDAGEFARAQERATS